MANIALPVEKERNWGIKLNSAINAINNESSSTAQIVATGRLSITSISNLIDDRIEGALGDVSLVGSTVDSGEAVKIIMFSDGTMRAVPLSVEAPAAPSALVAVASASSIGLSWNESPGATNYYVYRDGNWLATIQSPAYRDKGVLSGATHSYTVAASNQYGMVGPRSEAKTATVNPALNVPPTVKVTTFPKRLPLTGRAIVRVNARDVDAQVLALALGASTGQLEPTFDPSVWIFTI